MTVEQRVRTFVLENFYVSDAVALTDDLSLLDSGIVDSTGMLEIILFLESEFGISVGDEETVPDNLETIGRIGEYTRRKLAAA